MLKCSNRKNAIQQIASYEIEPRIPDREEKTYLQDRTAECRANADSKYEDS